VKAAIERHPAMVRQNHPAGCLPCQNGNAKILQTHWRHKGTGAPLPNRHRQLTPEPTPVLMPPLPGTPPGPTGNTSGAQHSQIVDIPAGYVYSQPFLPSAGSLTLYASAQDSQHDTDSDPDMLTDEGISTA